jgi:hypothetical protein
MSLPRTVAAILKEHVTLEIEGINRMYLNFYVPALQPAGGVAGFFRFHRGHQFASSALMDPISKALVASMEQFAQASIPAAALTSEEQAYRLQKKLQALTQVGVRVLHSLRQALDARPDTRQRQLLVSGDGSYTNRPMLRQLPERITFIGRIRKDAKSFQTLPPATATRSGGRPRHYVRPPPRPNKC